MWRRFSFSILFQFHCSTSSISRRSCPGDFFCKTPRGRLRHAEIKAISSRILVSRTGKVSLGGGTRALCAFRFSDEEKKKKEIARRGDISSGDLRARRHNECRRAVRRAESAETERISKTGGEAYELTTARRGPFSNQSVPHNTSVQ